MKEKGGKAADAKKSRRTHSSCVAKERKSFNKVLLFIHIVHWAELQLNNQLSNRKQHANTNYGLAKVSISHNESKGAQNVNKVEPYNRNKRNDKNIHDYNYHCKYLSNLTKLDQTEHTNFNFNM